MSKELTINGNSYQFPEQGDDATWGEEVTGWAESVTDVLNNLTSADDVLLTTFNLTNNQTTFTDIDGLQFSKTSVRSARVILDVYITTSSEELQETFDITVSYKNIADEFSIAIVSSGDNSGVTLDITNNGQIQYKTTNVAGTSYSGTATFKAAAILQQ